MSEVEAAPAGAGRAGKFIIAGAAIAFVAGFGLGAYAWSEFGAPLASGEEIRSDNTASTSVTDDGFQKVEARIGKLTLAIRDSDRQGVTRHMLITPIVVFNSTEASGPPVPGVPSLPDAISEMRDNFIEYLSQLTYPEVSGSAGMSSIRAELGRRASKLYPQADVDRVLFQDFLIQ